MKYIDTCWIKGVYLVHETWKRRMYPEILGKSRQRGWLASTGEYSRFHPMDKPGVKRSRSGLSRSHPLEGVTYPLLARKARKARKRERNAIPGPARIRVYIPI